MLDHIFLTVGDIDRSIAFYTNTLAPLGITQRVDYDGKDGPPGHPDLKGFGAQGRMFFWLRSGPSSQGSCMSASSPVPKRWCVPPMRLRSLLAPRRSIRPAPSFITTPATTPPR